MEKSEQQQICAEKLKGISKGVFADDRKAAMVEFDISYVTLWRYLKGDVKNVNLGVSLHTFLNERIENRKELLTA
jgi:hypothetical protein